MDLAPLKDDPALAANPKMNNNFTYAVEGNTQTQDRCPFAAHTRKTNPRADFKDPKLSTENSRMIRRGCPFGPELTPEEEANKRTQFGRGLMFVAYQSNITNGFLAVQGERLPALSRL